MYKEIAIAETPVDTTAEFAYNGAAVQALGEIATDTLGHPSEGRRQASSNTYLTPAVVPVGNTVELTLGPSARGDDDQTGNYWWGPTEV